jgi:hypothetical protein
MRIHTFLTPDGVYEETQVSYEIRDGDILVIANADGSQSIGYLAKAWPTIVIGPPGELHALRPEWVYDRRAKYPKTFAAIDALSGVAPPAFSQDELVRADPSEMTNEQLEQAANGNGYRSEMRLLGFHYRIKTGDGSSTGGTILATDLSDAKSILTVYGRRILGCPDPSITLRSAQ